MVGSVSVREKKAPKIGLDDQTFGERIKGLREQRLWSPTKLASESGVTATAINFYESDAREPGFFNGLALATALDVSPYYLAGEPEPALQEIKADSAKPREVMRLVPAGETQEFSRSVSQLQQDLADSDERYQRLVQRVLKLEDGAAGRGKQSGQA